LLPILAVFICFHNGISKNNQKVNVLLLLWWKKIPPTMQQNNKTVNGCKIVR
jgi:hypothetical protein